MVQNNTATSCRACRMPDRAEGRCSIIVGTGPEFVRRACAPVERASGFTENAEPDQYLGERTASPPIRPCITRSATQLAAVLPSTTPVGDGTITVNYNGQTSATAPIHVVANAIGLGTLYGTGNGLGLATDVNFNLLGLTRSATPGQAITLWGSGIGTDTRTTISHIRETKQFCREERPSVFCRRHGGDCQLRRAFTVSRAGSQIQYRDTCHCDLRMLRFRCGDAGSRGQQCGTIPVSASGGACTDPATGLTGTQLQSFAGKTNVNALLVSLSETLGSNGFSSVTAIAPVIPGSAFGKGYEYASQGSCTIVPPQQGTIFNFLAGGLDAGVALKLSGPMGEATIPPQMDIPGEYQVILPGSLTGWPGAYTVTGPGGKTAGSFNATINVSGRPCSQTSRPSRR